MYNAPVSDEAELQIINLQLVSLYTVESAMKLNNRKQRFEHYKALSPM